MSVTIAAFVLAAAAAQVAPDARPAAPPAPVESPRDAKPAVQLDPELQKAVAAFQHRASYRFHVDGESTSPWTAGGAPRFALDAVAEKSQPLAATATALEAFRGEDRIIYRATSGGEWSTFALSTSRGAAAANLAASAAKPATSAARGEARPDGGVRLLPFLATMPTPAQLLEDLPARIAACVRITADETTTTRVFELTYLPASAPRVEPAPIAGFAAKLRVVVRAGAIDELTFDARPPFTAARPAAAGVAFAGAPAAASTADTSETTLRYRIVGQDDVHVSIPEAVRRLLAR